MADWSNTPSLTETYASFVSSIRERDEDTAKMFNGTGSNLPDKTIRWNESADVFQVWSSSAAAWSAISPGLENLIVASASASHTFIKTEVYTASATWTRPPGCTAVEVWTIGGGGGGGAAHCVSGGRGRVAVAGGGGGGGASYLWKDTGVPALASVAVGAGGAGGQTVSAGDNGSASWWYSVTTVRGLGGFGGGAARSSTGAEIAIGDNGGGGDAPNGTLKFDGEAGARGLLAQYYTASSVGFNGGCGGSAGMFGSRTGDGGMRKTPFLNTNIIVNGTDATEFGSGGKGGAVSYGTAGAGADGTGGDGYQGVVIIKSYT